jgi:hypothetical protein
VDGDRTTACGRQASRPSAKLCKQARAAIDVDEPAVGAFAVLEMQRLDRQRQAAEALAKKPFEERAHVRYVVFKAATRNLPDALTPQLDLRRGLVRIRLLFLLTGAGSARRSRLEPQAIFIRRRRDRCR